MARRASAIIRYDGPALAGHEMDVHDLAPAMLALGDLCKIANEVLNGPSASVRVLVKADIEQKCFQFQLELIQSLYSQMTALLDTDAVQDAKNLLEWLGLVSGGTGAAVFGVFRLYKALFAKRDSEVLIEATAGRDVVIYQAVGEGATISVSPQVHRIAQDPRVFPAVKRVLMPLTREGYEKLEFESEGRVTEYFTREEAARIVAAAESSIVMKSDKELVS